MAGMEVEAHHAARPHGTTGQSGERDFDLAAWAMEYAAIALMPIAAFR